MTKQISFLTASCIGLGLLLMAQGLDAQELPRALESRAPVVYIDFAGLASNAVGEFGDLVGAGGGVNLSAKVFLLEDSRNFGLRADLGWVIYGLESVPTCISDPCRVQTDVKTSNNIFYFGLGPEVILIQGRFEPYVYGPLELRFLTLGQRSRVNTFREPRHISTPLTSMIGPSPGVQAGASATAFGNTSQSISGWSTTAMV